jgi:hypothetical protein
VEVYSNQVVNWFSGLPFHTQCMLAVILVFWLLFNLSYNHKVISFGPAILITLGIFATFLGIALGLGHFNVGDLQGSVPELLDGLKTAIWASVAGVGGALLLKLRHSSSIELLQKEVASTATSLLPISLVFSVEYNQR